jgi:hypothetical protein
MYLHFTSICPSPSDVARIHLVMGTYILSPYGMLRSITAFLYYIYKSSLAIEQQVESPVLYILFAFPFP